MKSVVDFSGGKMDEDTDPRYLAKGLYLSLVNGRVMDSLDGDGGVVSGMKGMEEVVREPFLVNDKGEVTGSILGMEAIEDEIYVIGYGELAAYSVHIDIVGDGKVVVEPDKEYYEMSEIVTIKAVADSGWSFSEFKGYENEKGELSVRINGDIDITVVFEKIPDNSFVIGYDNYINGDNTLGGKYSGEKWIGLSYVRINPVQNFYARGDRIEFTVYECGVSGGSYTYKFMNAKSRRHGEIVQKSKKLVPHSTSGNFGNEYVFEYVVGGDDEVMFNWEPRGRFFYQPRFDVSSFGGLNSLYDTIKMTQLDYRCPDFDGVYYYSDARFKEGLGAAMSFNIGIYRDWMGEPSELKAGSRIQIRFGFGTKDRMRIVEQNSGIIFDSPGGYGLVYKEWTAVLDKDLTIQLYFKKQ